MSRFAWARRGPLCALAIIVVAGSGLAITAAARPAPPAVPAKNPVQREMKLLEAAMRDAVSAIARGDVRALPARLHAVHLAAGSSTAALRSGAYRPPRNGDQVEAFIALDGAFHDEMIKMVQAARSNDVATTATQFGVLMNRCHACHAQYVAPPPPAVKR